MINVFIIKVNNNQAGSAYNTGFAINVGFSNFSKTNTIADNRGDFVLQPTLGGIFDPDLIDAKSTPFMVEAL